MCSMCSRCRSCGSDGRDPNNWSCSSKGCYSSIYIGSAGLLKGIEFT